MDSTAHPSEGKATCRKRILVLDCSEYSPRQMAFWRRLNEGLRAHQHEIVLLRYHDVPREELHGLECHRAPFLRLADYTPLRPEASGGRFAPIPLPAAVRTACLEADAAFFGVAGEDDDPASRAEALDFLAYFFHVALTDVAPVLVLLWNGCHAPELLMKHVARDSGVPVSLLERGPFARTIHLTQCGTLADSEVGRATEVAFTDDALREAGEAEYRERTAAYVQSGSTWYEQPETDDGGGLRARLNIEERRRVVLFLGQVDADSQNILYSPFKDGLDAFTWFCDQLRGRDDIFVIGKHHPRSDVPAERFQETVAGLGAWLDDCSMRDCLAAADRVAAVNSTGLYEALMLGKPVLTLGRSLLSGKGIAYEVQSPKAEDGVINAWLAAEDADRRTSRWNVFAAHLLGEVLFDMTSDDGLRSCASLAKSLAEEHAGPIPCVSRLALEHPGLLSGNIRQIMLLQAQVGRLQTELKTMQVSDAWRLRSMLERHPLINGAYVKMRDALRRIFRARGNENSS